MKVIGKQELEKKIQETYSQMNQSQVFYQAKVQVLAELLEEIEETKPVKVERKPEGVREIPKETETEGVEEIEPEDDEEEPEVEEEPEPVKEVSREEMKSLQNPKPSKTRMEKIKEAVQKGNKGIAEAAKAEEIEDETDSFLE